MAKPFGIVGEEKKFKRSWQSDVVGWWRGEKGVARGRASNLISIITKESRGYRYRRRNIFFIEPSYRGGSIQIVSLLLSFIGFLSLFRSISRQLRYFRISVAMIFHGETKRSSAGGPHFNQYTRFWSAAPQEPSSIVPPRLWVSIKINIRTRVSSHRKYAAHPSCNRRDCSYIGSHVSVPDRPVCNIAHWWSLRNYSNQFFDVDLVDFSCAQRVHAILHAMSHIIRI